MLYPVVNHGRRANVQVRKLKSSNEAQKQASGSKFADRRKITDVKRGKFHEGKKPHWQDTETQALRQLRPLLMTYVRKWLWRLCLKRWGLEEQGHYAYEAPDEPIGDAMKSLKIEFFNVVADTPLSHQRKGLKHLEKLKPDFECCLSSRKIRVWEHSQQFNWMSRTVE